MSPAPKLHMITAGLGSGTWEAASRRLARQAHRSAWFESVEAVDTKSAKSVIRPFFTDNREFLEVSPRGFGYWLWRPYLIRSVLSRLKPSSILLFLDAGCELNINSTAHRRLEEYARQAARHEVCAMRTPHLMTSWSKGDTLNLFRVPWDSTLRTIEPGVMLLRAGTENLALMDRWIELARRDSYHHLDDSPSTAANAPGFVEHRHDQALLTGLLKDRPEAAMEQETDFSATGWTRGKDFPIWVVRNHLPVVMYTGGPLATLARAARTSVRKVRRG